MTDPVSCPTCGKPLTPVYIHQGITVAPTLLYWECDMCGTLWSVDQIREHLEKTEHAFGDPIHG